MSEPQAKEEVPTPFELMLQTDCKVVVMIASQFPKEAMEIIGEIFKRNGKGLHPRSPLMRLADAMCHAHGQAPD